ncbi:hypothetical protein BDC45DRAFT_539291 [Circinella umbellata]|nr:hypothetical protein BDC45DRAFT_539291 [Circinella umbellata]
MRYYFITLTLAAVMGLGSLLSSVHADGSHLSAQLNIERRDGILSPYPKRQGGQYPGGAIFRGEPDENENEPDENEPNEDGIASYYGSRTPTTLGHPSTPGRFPKRQGGQYPGGAIFRGEPDEDENEPDENEPNEDGTASYYGSRTPKTLGHPSTFGRFPKRQGGPYTGGVIFRGEPDEDENEPDENEPNEDGAASYYGSRTPTALGHPSTPGRFPKRQGGPYTGGVIFRGEPDEDENEPDEEEPDENEPNEDGTAIYYGSKTPTTFGHPSTPGEYKNEPNKDKSLIYGRVRRSNA